MTSPATNTKLELVVESIESFSAAIYSLKAARSVNENARCREEVDTSRKALRASLADLIAPTLRIVG